MLVFHPGQDSKIVVKLYKYFQFTKLELNNLKSFANVKKKKLFNILIVKKLSANFTKNF